MVSQKLPKVLKIVADKLIEKDEADILDVLKASKENLIHEAFRKLDKRRIHLFAERFGQKERVASLFEKISSGPRKPEKYKL